MTSVKALWVDEPTEEAYCFVEELGNQLRKKQLRRRSKVYGM